jgi:hypothetical protein
MVVDDFDMAWSSFLPDEADAPLVVDQDAVLAGAVAFQRFQPIAGRDTQILQDARLIEQTQFAQRRRLDIRRKRAASPA